MDLLSSVRHSFKAIFLSLLTVFVYVGSLYFWKQRVRNDPITIKLRFVSVTFACVFATLLVWKLVPPKDEQRLCDQLGSCFHEIDLVTVLVWPLVISCILFLGPIVVLVDTYTLAEFKEHLLEELWPTNLMVLRNYVVAPISEEFIFRAVMVCFMKEISSNSWFLVILTSLIFSFAHSHHYFFQEIQGAHKISVQEWLFQIMYTMIFGCYCAIFYLKTGSFLTSVILHTFCNFMGFPDIETLYSRKKYWRSALAGLVMWFAIIVYYLV